MQIIYCKSTKNFWNMYIYYENFKNVISYNSVFMNCI